MTAPSQMSLRRIPDALRLKVGVAYAQAWEALVDTHARQAVQFVSEFAPRLPVLEAMTLYFRVTAIPESMREVVRSRTLISLDLEVLAPLAPLPTLTGWQRLRPDLWLENRRQRVRYQEKTVELARMVGARAAEAVIATHVENAVGFTHLVEGVIPANAAIGRYLREFGLPDGLAQMVRQRAQARVAGRELTAQYDDPDQQLVPPPVLPEPASESV
ncbi:MAG TPA: hypothetical protein VHJ69_10325 [Gemmatimonadales bacterium]|nr:hypothetical protein [Gemmatimonadales bacterium]